MPSIGAHHRRNIALHQRSPCAGGVYARSSPQWCSGSRAGPWDALLHTGGWEAGLQPSAALGVLVLVHDAPLPEGSGTWAEQVLVRAANPAAEARPTGAFEQSDVRRRGPWAR